MRFSSVKPPLVSDKIRQMTYTPERLRQAHGRQLATVYNCYGCHNLEGNDPHIQLFFDVHNDDGSWNFNRPLYLNPVPWDEWALLPVREFDFGMRTSPITFS